MSWDFSCTVRSALTYSLRQCVFVVQTLGKILSFKAVVPKLCQYVCCFLSLYIVLKPPRPNSCTSSFRQLTTCLMTKTVSLRTSLWFAAHKLGTTKAYLTHSQSWNWVKVSSQLHAPAALPRRKGPSIPIG